MQFRNMNSYHYVNNTFYLKIVFNNLKTILYLVTMKFLLKCLKYLFNISCCDDTDDSIISIDEEWNSILSDISSDEIELIEIK